MLDLPKLIVFLFAESWLRKSPEENSNIRMLTGIIWKALAPVQLPLEMDIFARMARSGHVVGVATPFWKAIT